MATYTTNYNLKLPDGTDTYRRMNQNDNMVIIDGALKNLDTNKIPKVTSPVANNIAILDANGNVIDSGKSIGNIPTIDSALSGTSTNPVQNKIIKIALDNKVDKVANKGLSTNDLTDALKTKLDGIATGANNTVIDSALSDVSTNPVQNKIIKVALDGKLNRGGDTMTGILVAQANTAYTTYQVRNIALSTTAAIPTGNGSLLGVHS